MYNVSDIRDFDSMLKRRIAAFREDLRQRMAGRRLTLAEAKVHRVLIPMVGVYTPGWQALPAASWAFVELVTKEGLVGTGEWSIDLDEPARAGLERLRAEPNANLLDLAWEEPFFMAWWDLVGQVLGKALHLLWGELFQRDFTPPREVPMAAYTWQRFPDMQGRDEVTFETWPQHALQRVRQGFPVIKVSMTAYEPEDHIELVHRIREAVGPDTPIRIDSHGTWNYQEARRILHALEDCNLEYIEQPVNALVPRLYWPRGEPMPRSIDEGGYQVEYYFRRMTELRRELRTPLSCHWWTPPILYPPGASVMSGDWAPNWELMQRYEAADVSVPDIGLGVAGFWRICQLARFMGMHLAIHSNFEMCLQLAFRAAMGSALMYDGDSAGLYMGTTPRICHAIDNETIQVGDDVIEGGQFDWTGGHLILSDKPGHGLRLDPEQVERYRYGPEAVARYRAYAEKLYADYRLDRPRRPSQSGWPKRQQAEHFHRHTYPYDLAKILGAEQSQDVDLQLNRYEE